MLPAALLAYECLRTTDEPKRRFVRLLPFVALGALYLAVRWLVIGAGPPMTSATPWTFLFTAAVVLQRFLTTAVWPSAGVVHHPLELFETPTPEVITALTLLAGIIVLTVVLWRRHRVLAFWPCWWLLWLSIWLNVGCLGEYLLSEKGAYLATGGLCVLVATALIRVRYHTFLILTLVAVHFSVTHYRAGFWSDPVGFYRESIRSAPDFATLHYQLGLELVQRRQYADARTAFERVIEIEPRHSLGLLNLGNCLSIEGEETAAAKSWSRALEADPGNVNAAFNLARHAEERGDLAAALAHYRRYVAGTTSPQPSVLTRIRDLEKRLRGR